MAKSKKAQPKKKSSSTQNELVKCDLEFPRLQEELANLETDQIEAFFDTVENKIQKMTWQQIYQTSSKKDKRGLNWEKISGQETASGKPIASIRITQKIRARVMRENEYMRFISIHPDHDSAYKEEGGEDI